ncbi:hypothetical protein DXG01_002778 [Tephrocybe rancida]|nr:hypothetical protein DXG01_002778 [Tephrocybe rancida]
MPPADNDPTGPAPDGKKPSLGKRFLNRVKGLESTKSSSASSAPTTQLMEIRTASAAGEKPSLSKRLLASSKGSKFIKSSSAQSTPAAQSAENLTETQVAFLAPGTSAAQLMASVDTDRLQVLSQLLRSPKPIRGYQVSDERRSRQSRDPSCTHAYKAAGPTPAINVDQRGFVTPAARNPVSLANINLSTLPGLNVPQQQSKFKEGINVALDGCLTALRVAKEASEWNPFLKAVLGAVMSVIDLAKTVSGNSQDINDILDHIQALLPILETSAKRLEGRKDGFGKENNLMNFAIMMQTELKKIQQMQLHGLFRRVLQGTSDADTLQGVYKNISKALEQFKVDGEPVYWLTGPAGIGKTTIAKTICELVDDRYNGANATWSMHLNNILRHLCDHSSSYAACLVEALEKDSRLAHATLDIQLKQMLIQPWEASTSERVGLPSVIIVVDALDESTDGSVFLQHLLHAIEAAKLRGLKFFMTSREDEEISRLCDILPQGTVLHLQDIQKQTVQTDIRLYLRKSLPDIYIACQEHFEKLIKLSDGLFIYAATVVKMVMANNAALTEQVEVLQGIVDLNDRLHLEGLYSHIVRSAVSHHKNSVQASRLQVLHTILCAMHPISAAVVAQLARTTVDVVATVLKKLHAVMYKAHDGMIYTYHASFADYIHQAPTATETAFNPHCNVGLHHTFLAKRCYEIMEGQLCFNICSLESSFVKDADIPDIQNCIEEKIDNSLKYAVLKWMAHLDSTSEPDETLLNKTQHFVERLLLYWMEVVNLVNARREGMQMLDMLTAWIDQYSPNTLGLWEETLKFCQFFFSGSASQSTPHFIGFSPDGKQVVSGNGDKSVHIWDALTGDLLKELKGHTDSVKSVAFSPDGKQVVSGSEDRSVRIWDALTGGLSKELKGHTGWVKSAAFSPDGKQVVSGSKDRLVHIWDAFTGHLVKELKGHTDFVRSVAFSPGGTQVVSGSMDRSVRIWDALTGDLVNELKGHTDSVKSVAFSPDGKQVVSGSYDNSVHIWDAFTGDLVKELKGHTDWVWSVAFSPDGKQVVSGSKDRSVHIWDALTGDLVKELKGHTNCVKSVSFSPDGKWVVSGSDDESVRIWDASAGDLDKELKRHTNFVKSVAFSPNGKQVLSGSYDKSVHIWDAFTGDLVKKLKGHTDWVWSVAYSPDGEQVVSGSKDRSVCIWDALTGNLVKELKGHTDSVKSVAFSPDGKQVVSGSFDESVCIWDALTGDLDKELKGHTDWVWSVAFSPDGKQVVSGSNDRSVHIWDVLTGDLVKELKGHTGWVLSVAFSPDGKKIVSGSIDESVHIWDALTGDLDKELKGHTDWVWSVAFSPNGKQVVSGSDDTSVCIWNALTGGLVKELKGHTDFVQSVAFSPDGQQVLSGSKDGSLRIWDVLARDLVNRLMKQSLAGSSDESIISKTIEGTSDSSEVKFVQDLIT